MKIDIYKGYKPLCYINKEEILVFKQMKFYIFNLSKSEFKYICTLPVKFIKKLLWKVRICQRIFRLVPRTAIYMEDNKALVSFNGGVYLLDIEAKNIVKVHQFREGMSNVLSFSKISKTRNVDKGIYYGDYFGNFHKDGVGIYKYDEDLGSFKKVFEFLKGEINHIHQIVEDKYRDLVWIFTGDSGEAASIWYTKDNFKSVTKFLVGSQLYRACKVFVVEEGLIYATDAPLEQNYIRLIKIKNEEISDENLADINAELKKENERLIAVSEENLAKIDGASIYGGAEKEGFLWSTTVEPDDIYGSNLFYLLSYKRGPGIKSWNSYVLLYEYNNRALRVINSYKKDIYPMGLCQFGSVMILEDEFECGKRILYGIGLGKIDNKMIVIS
ncbi:hypothetical protein [Clostridium culturomicium]|uniref:hypothetical protein n=1 Tax=Clostridium culturomicium TaxID=1499683 RepID=UPI003857242B